VNRVSPYRVQSAGPTRQTELRKGRNRNQLIPRFDWRSIGKGRVLSQTAARRLWAPEGRPGPRPTAQDAPLLLRVAEAARLLRVSRSAMYQLVA